MKPDPPGWPIARTIALAVIAALQAFWFSRPGPLHLELLIACGLAVSLIRPAYGLLLFAGLAPLSTTVAGLSGDSSLGARMLEQLALGVGAGALLQLAPADGRTRIGRPAWFVGLVAVGSAATLMPAAAAPVMRNLGDSSSPIWAPIFAAMAVAACALLAWAAERTIRRSPGLAALLVMAGLIGGAGAAALNLHRLVVAALRAPDVFRELLRLLLTVRFSSQMDWNAGASTLILLGIAGTGLMRGSWARRAGVGLLVALVAVGVWIAGSRIALAMVVAAAFAAMLWQALRARRGRAVLMASAAVLVAAAGVWLTIYIPTRHNEPVGQSVGFRRLMLEAGVAMVKKAPLFGVGMHKFFDESETFAGPALVRMHWPSPKENAHNNFMQVLAEEGVVGLAAMIWWLAAVLVPAARAERARPDPLRGALLLAVAAAIGTWLTGHPLLVPQFAFVFWLYCGVLAATTEPPVTDRMRVISWVLTAALLLSVPLRASALRDAADLEHRGFGLSALWQHDDTQRYRVAEGAFALYLPATGRPVEIPVRRSSDTPEWLVVEVRIAGEWVKQIEIGGDEWQTISVVVPASSRRFVLVDFTVHDATSRAIVTGAALRVGLDRAK